MNETATIDRAERLMAQGKTDEAVALTAALVTGPAPSHMALAAHAGALKAVGRREDALAFDLQAIERFASSPIAWHNLAATLDDLGRGQEAVDACRRAFSLGLDAPETWGVYARALQATGDHDEAERALRQAMLRTPASPTAAAELSNLIWMRRGDVQEAVSVLDAAFHAGGPATPLILLKSSLFVASGDEARAANLLEAAVQQIPGNLAILIGATETALRTGRLAEAERHVQEAAQLDPNSRGVAQYGAMVDLALGRPEAALAKLKAALADRPDDQSLWGWAATAARAAGDPLYGELCDYDAVVGAYDLQTPDGWPSLDAFLRDLGKALKELHKFDHHPTSQSLRHGSQTLHLLTGSDDAAIKAFFRGIDPLIREHMAKLGTGADPLRRRNTFDYRIQGAWSVRLQPGGFHTDHFHAQGWLSSAFYVETPDAALETEDRQGWIRFGKPPFVTDPPMDAAHYVKPKPGRLVLFPSYMWHGTVPFTTDENRLTIAFDAVPK
jgi:uncharacterized protein (TIGR02466 family)